MHYNSIYLLASQCLKPKTQVDLAETAPKGDFESALVPYLEEIQHPTIQNLPVPDQANQRFGDINFYQLNMHILAIYGMH